MSDEVTTVERVARAIWVAQGGAEKQFDRDMQNPVGRAHWMSYARAAIAVMREPTTAQYDALCATNKLWRELDSKTVWQTYIDAALTPEQE